MRKELTQAEIESIGLPKWPGLLVKGTSVTREQAAEIILRTDGSYGFSCNEKAWTLQCLKAIGYNGKMSDYGSIQDYDLLCKCETAIGKLELHYVTNSQIASYWIGGPHGWINWDGTIGCNHFNIGKWPSTVDVLEDLRKIAEAWPFLSMVVQLLDKETCEDNPSAVIEYVISQGNVTTYLPEKMLCDIDNDRDWCNHVQFGWERGCTIEMLQEAVALAKKSANKS